MLDTETDPRRLLLVWVHGFKGDESTFLSFPQDLADTYQAKHPTWDIQHVIYPKYKTAGQLAHCTEAFVKWVEKRVAFQREWESEAGSLQSGQSDAAGKHGSYGAELSPEDEKRNGEAAKGDVPQQSPTGVVLVGHSMGGLLVADAATKWLRPEAGMPAENGTLLRIRSVIALDTPFIGINPSLVSYGVNQLDAAVARLHTSTSSFITRSPSSVQKTWKSIGGDRLLSPPTQSIFGADSRIVKGVQWGLDIAATGSERGFMADMGIPALGRSKNETEAERKEREERREREKKEKVERKEREKRVKKEKTDQKEREKVEKAEKKEREKKQKEERKEKEKREKEQRKEKEKSGRGDDKEREMKEKKREQEMEQRGKAEDRELGDARVTIDKDKMMEQTAGKQPEESEYHKDERGDTSFDQHEQDVGNATSKLAVSNDVVQSAHNEKDVRSGHSVVRVSSQETDSKESYKDVEISAEESLPSASTNTIGPQPVFLPTLSLPSSAENSSTDLLRVANPGTVPRTTSAGPSASTSRTPSVVSMDSAASDFSSDTNSSSNDKKQRRGWQWLQSHMIFLLSLWRTEEVWRRMRVLAEMQKEGLGFVNIYTVVPHPEEKPQSSPKSPSAPPTSPCTFISLPATTQIPANSWRPFEIDVSDQVTAHMALFMRDKNKRYDELMEMIMTQIDDDM